MEKICATPGCTNVGQYKEKHPKTGKVYRRRLCYGCRYRGTIKSKTRHNAKWRMFKKEKCSKCEYCGWAGPCEVHRSIPELGYEIGNMRAACPNCHRLLDMGLMDDPYTI